MVPRKGGFFLEVLEEHYIRAKEEVEGGWGRVLGTGFCGLDQGLFQHKMNLCCIF